MRKPWLLTVALLSALALVGAACAEEQAPPTSPGAQPGATPTFGPLGGVVIGPGEPIKIAVFEALSGDVASLGQDQLRAVEIAIDDLGGELLGHPLEIAGPFDDLCNEQGGTTGAQRIVADETIVAVVGTSCSGAAVPAMEILSEAGYSMVSGSNTSPILTSAGGVEGAAHKPGYYRTAHNDEIQGRAAATFAFQELGVRKAATINDGDPYTQGLTAGFEAPFKEMGGEIVVSTAISKGDTDMRPVLTEIAAAGAELIFFPIFQPEGDFIVKQAREIEGLEDTALMGADGLLSDTFVEPIPEVHQAPPGPNGTERGMYFSGPATPDTPGYREFVEKYRQKYGEDPIQAFHAHAYDAFMLIVEAIKKVAVDVQGTLYIDRQALRDAIGQTSGYQGLTGTLTCDQFGDCADPKIQIFQATPDRKTLPEVKENVLFEYEPQA